MHAKNIGQESLYHHGPTLASRAQSLAAMFVFFLFLFALLSGPAWLPLVVDRLFGR